jgi:hypothetical protein
MLCGISSSFPEVFPTSGQVTHVLLTRPPLNWRVAPPASFDLHVLSTPPAFILSQDQTLHLKSHDADHRSDRRRSIPVKSEILFFSIQVCFCESSKKIDVWHALLSFQGTDPPGLFDLIRSARPDAPYFRRSLTSTSIQRRKFQFRRFFSVRQPFFATVPRWETASAGRPNP